MSPPCANGLTKYTRKGITRCRKMRRKTKEARKDAETQIMEKLDTLINLVKSMKVSQIHIPPPPPPPLVKGGGPPPPPPPPPKQLAKPDPIQAKMLSARMSLMNNLKKKLAKRKLN